MNFLLTSLFCIRDNRCLSSILAIKKGKDQVGTVELYFTSSRSLWLDLKERRQKVGDSVTCDRYSVSLDRLYIRPLPTDIFEASAADFPTVGIIIFIIVLYF